MRFLYTLLAICLIFQGCKKEESIKKFIFTNKIAQKVTVNIYGSKEDYNNNTNLLYTGEASSNGTLEIPYTIFKKETQEYYLDWYSADFKYTNWNEFINDDVFTPADSNRYTTTDAELGYTNIARALILNGNGTGTKWKTTSSYDNNQTWNALSPNERDYEIEFHKNMTASVKAKNVTSDYTFTVTGYSGQFGVIIRPTLPIVLTFRYLADTIPMNTNRMFFEDVLGAHGLYIEKQP